MLTLMSTSSFKPRGSVLPRKQNETKVSHFSEPGVRLQKKDMQAQRDLKNWRHDRAAVPSCRDKESSMSNLDSFLECTTPSVPCKVRTMDVMRDGLVDGIQSTTSVPYFNLADLWAFYKEPSVYGMGVPIGLADGANVTQYYIPYLSAIQIYLRSHHPCPLYSKHRRQGDDSDASEFEFSSDTDASSRSCVKFDSLETRSSLSSGRSSSIEDADGHGNHIFEYFENSHPSARDPFTRKIDELAQECPALYSLRSDELSSASWFSVAWYPTYRIPTGPTMYNWQTAFLTYHSLWTPSSTQDTSAVSNEVGINGDDEVEGPRTEKSVTGDPLEVVRQCDVADGHIAGAGIQCHEGNHEEQWLVSRLPWRWKGSEMLELEPFGLVSYKLSAPYFAGSQASAKKCASLARSADLWIRQLKIHHPDFSFFCKPRY